MIEFSGQSGSSRQQGSNGRLYLKEYRSRANLTLKQLAVDMKLHYTAIQKWETGITSPTADNLFRLAEVYGIHPAALFLEPSTMNGNEKVGAIGTIAYGEGQRQPMLEWGNPSNSDEFLRKLNRCATVLHHVTIEWAEHWLRLAELSQAA